MNNIELLKADKDYKGVDLYDKTGMCASCGVKSDEMRLKRQGTSESYWCKRCSYSFGDNDIPDIDIGEIVLCFNEGYYDVGEIKGKVEELRWNNLTGEQTIYIVDFKNGEPPTEVNEMYIERLSKSAQKKLKGVRI